MKTDCGCDHCDRNRLLILVLLVVWIATFSLESCSISRLEGEVQRLKIKIEDRTK